MKLDQVARDAAPLLARVHADAFDTPWQAADIANLLDAPSAFAILAHESDAALGFILAWAPAGQSEILTLAVRPSARRKGVGLALVNGAVAAALLRGASEMFLEVAEDNEAARALYMKLGFAESGRRRGYYEHTDGAKDALVLSRRLPRPAV